MPAFDPVTVPLGGAEPLLGSWIRILLSEARERTLWLVESVSDQDLERVHDPLMSPLVWDLGHIAAFEDLWVSGRGTGMAPLRPDLMEVYDATETPRAGRGGLPYLRRAEALEYMEAVRERALQVLDGMDLSPGLGDLHSGGFLWELLVQHEQQHTETMLQTLLLGRIEGYVHPGKRDAPPAPGGHSGLEFVPIEGGLVELGARDGRFSYDNERPRHAAHVKPFLIARTPITNATWLEFAEGGGYEFNLALIGMCLALIFSGAGPLSMDRCLQDVRKKAAAASPPTTAAATSPPPCLGTGITAPR